MCQPKPLARCVNHARKDLLKARQAVVEVLKEHDENKNLLKALHQQHNDAVGTLNRDKVDAKDSKLNRIASSISDTKEKVSESKKKVDEAWDNITEKEMLVDSTKTGRKNLATYGNRDHNAVRLQIAEEMAQWQRSIKGHNDFTNQPVIDKDGKFSDQAVPVFQGILKNSKTNYSAALKIEEVAASRVKHAQAYVSEIEKKVRNGSNSHDEKRYYENQQVVSVHYVEVALNNKDLARRERIMYYTQIKDMKEAISKAQQTISD